MNYPDNPPHFLFRVGGPGESFTYVCHLRDLPIWRDAFGLDLISIELVGSLV